MERWVLITEPCSPSISPLEREAVAGASVIAAVAATHIAQDLRADVRVGIVAQVVLPVVERTQRHAALITAARRGNNFGGLAVLHHVRSRGRFLLLVGFGRFGRRSEDQSQADRENSN